MKLIIIIVLSTLFSNNIFSQSGWIQQNSGITTNLNSVKFTNSNTGWCVGNNGVILKTTNGGAMWLLQTSNVTFDLKYLSITSQNIGYCAGNSNTFLKTTNGGLNWNPIIIDTLGLSEIKSFFFVSDTVGYLSGYVEYLFKTTNGGINWEYLSTDNYLITSIYFINDLTGWISQINQVISNEYNSRTTNGGLNWYGGVGGFTDPYPPYFYDSLHGWFTTLYGNFSQKLYKTTDGVNWISFSLSQGIHITSIFFTSQLNGFGVAQPRIYYTSNSGSNWILQSTSDQILNSIFFTDSLTGWVVGDSGIILKTTTGGILTNFTNTSTEIPDKYFLSQNYPNPFNPVTNLEFGIPELEFVSLKIFDVLGNEVSTLVNENKPAGRYEVTFNGAGLPSGVYFYKLVVSSSNSMESGVFRDIKRMVLVK